MKKFLACIIATIALLTVSANADEGLVVDFNSWISTGQTKWRHDASAQNSDYGVPTSELDYQGVNSNVVEVRVMNILPSGQNLRLTVGKGFIDDGTLVDDDYLSASGAINLGATQSGAHRWSRTHSDIDGNGLFYLKGEFIPDNLQYSTSWIDVGFSFGLHYWQEEYTASGIRQIECTLPSYCTPGFTGYSGVTVITNRVEWTGLGAAVESLFNFTERFALQLDFTFYPVMSLVNEDTHHLRSDLSQDPSIRMTGDGLGYDFIAGFKLQINRKFSAQLGYRVWERWVENQTITFYGASGGSSSARLMNFKTRREGIFGGVEFEF